MSGKTEVISQQQLIDKIRDLDCPDEELAKYFILDNKNSHAFAPNIIPNPDLITDSGLEGAFFYQCF